MPRRTVTALAALAGAVAALAAVAGTGVATATEQPDPRASSVPPAKADYLSITVRNTGDPAHDRTYSLFCHPAGGTHPQPEAACKALDKAAAEARTAEGPGAGRVGAADRTRRVPSAGPFAPVPAEAMCTMVHGGPATARIEGVWRGKPVDARFDRSNGCEMSRWDRLVPALPALD